MRNVKTLFSNVRFTSISLKKESKCFIEIAPNNF